MDDIPAKRVLERKISVIHAVLAATFVTLSLVALVLDKVKNPEHTTSKAFLLFYGLGTLLWGIAGRETQSFLLIGISVVQFACVLYLTLTNFREIS